MTYDNPPARLQSILVAGLQADRAMPCRQVWAELLSAPENDSNLLFSCLGKVMALPNESMELIGLHFPNLLDSAVLWRDPIEAAFFNQQLGGKWESFIQHINPYCVPQLATLSELIHTKLGALLAEDSAVSDLIERIAKTISEVETGDLPASLKHYVLQELRSLRLNLSEYRIIGSSPAIRQAEAMVGHTSRDKGFFDFLTNHETGKRVLDNLNAVVGILTVYVAVSQIAAPGFALLPK